VTTPTCAQRRHAELSRVRSHVIDNFPHSQELYAAPTREEMVDLRETENLFKSNLFRLQVHSAHHAVTANMRHTCTYMS
jgi:hypothetical protein